MLQSKKIKKAVYFKEYAHILHGIEKKISNISLQTYRLTLSIYKSKLKKEVNSIDGTKSNIKTLLKNKFGDFSHFLTSPELKQNIISQANQYCNKNFELLGARSDFGKKINWHIDFKSGFEWKKGKFYLDYTQVDLSNNADVKIPRELSRSHHLLIMGQAYLLTKDEKYTHEFKSQIEDWIDENPLMKSINWGCAMDVAIRAANWIYALNMFIDSEQIDQKFLKKMNHSLYQHGWFIEKNLEKSFKYNSNHYDGDIGGLLLIGLYFKDLKRGKRWFDLSKYALFDEIRKQIYPSGMELEKSSYYHRLVLEIFSYSVFILKRNEVDVPSDIEFRMHKMYTFIHEIELPDATLPIFGDNDSSRYLPFDFIYRDDIKYITDLGRAYFKDEIFDSNRKPSSDVFFLLDAGSNLTYDGNNKHTKKELTSSKIFPDVGIVKLSNDDIHLLVNNSSPGRFIDDPFAGGSHAHADLLSFVLCIHGKQIFVDPGSYVYTSDHISRNRFRSTPMHNTISIDSKSQFLYNEKDLFYFTKVCEVNNLLFQNDELSTVYIGAHNAYEHIKKDIIHTREFKLSKKENKLLIKDVLTGAKDHKPMLHYHLHPDISVDKEDNLLVLKNNGKKLANLIIESVTKTFITIQDSDYSSEYGSKKGTKAIQVSFESHDVIEVTSSIHISSE